MGGLSQTAIKAGVLGAVGAAILFLIMYFIGLGFLQYLMDWALPVGVGFLAVTWKKTSDIVANVIEGATSGVIYGILAYVIVMVLILIFTSFAVFGFDFVVFIKLVLISAGLAAVGGVLAGMMG